MNFKTNVICSKKQYKELVGKYPGKMEGCSRAGRQLHKQEAKMLICFLNENVSIQVVGGVV